MSIIKGSTEQKKTQLISSCQTISLKQNWPGGIVAFERVPLPYYTICSIARFGFH
jgi:hypothetical protein